MTRCNRPMTRAFVVAAFAATLLAGCGEQPPEQALAQHVEVFGRYCTDCHNDAEAAGELSLEHVTAAGVAAKPEIFEQVVRKLRGGLMPPPGEPRPDAENAHALVVALERQLDAAAATRGLTAGRVALHRMNRTNTHGRSSNCSACASTPALCCPPTWRARASTTSQKCCASRRPTSSSTSPRRATSASWPSARRHAAPTRADYRAERALRTAHVDGLPLGTRDGLLVEHNFPADGDVRDQLEHLVDSGLRAARLSVRLARVRAHGRRDARRGQGVRRQYRRRGRFQGARSRPDQRGRGDQEPLPRHPRRRQSGPAQRRRRVRGPQLRRRRLSPPGARARRGRARHSAALRHGDHRAVRADGHRGADREPRADLQLLPAERR